MYLYDVIIYLDIIYEYAHDYVKKKKKIELQYHINRLKLCFHFMIFFLV